MNAAEAGPSPTIVVIGVGDELRGDDAIGPRVAERLRGERGISVRCCESVDMLEAWAAADAAVIVDAMRSGAAPGTIIRFDVTREPLSRSAGRGAVHSVGVADAIELARVLERLPASLFVHAVEGERFDLGAGLSETVQRALEPLLAAVRTEICDLRSRAVACGSRDPSLPADAVVH